MSSKVIKDYAKELEIMIEDMKLSSNASTEETSVQEAGSIPVPGSDACATTMPVIKAPATAVTDNEALATNVSDNEALATTVHDNKAFTTTMPDNEACTATVPDNEAPTNVPDNEAPTNVPDNEALATNVPGNEACTASVPDNEACTTTAPDNEACTASVPNNEACTASVPNNEACTTTVPNYEALATTVPDNEACTASVPNNEVCTTTVPNNEALATTVPDNEACTTTVPNNEALATTVPDNEACTTTVPDDEACAATVSDDEACVATVSDDNKLGKTLEEVKVYHIISRVAKMKESIETVNENNAKRFIKSLYDDAALVELGNVNDYLRKFKLYETLESEYKQYLEMVDPVLQRIQPEEINNLPFENRKAILIHLMTVKHDIKYRLKTLNLIKKHSRIIKKHFSKNSDKFAPETPQSYLATLFLITLICLIEALESIIDQLGKNIGVIISIIELMDSIFEDGSF